MTIHLDFEECIKDSPNFRDSVLHSEIESAELENQLDRMTKTCSAMIESGKTFSNVSSVFVSSLDDFAKLNKNDAFVQKALGQFSTTMSEISNFHLMLFEHAQTSVKNQLLDFLKKDVKGARDAKKAFDRASDEYSSCLSKHAAVSKVKPAEVEDVSATLNNTRTHFRKVAMDYVVQVNMLKKKNRYQVIDKLLSFMHALATFFHQGYELMKDQEPFLKKISAQLEELHREAEDDYSLMMSEQGRYKRMTGDAGLHMRHEAGRLIIEGYLFKRASNAFKTWNRRWFTIRDNKLFYQKKKDDATVVIEDVRLCTMRLHDDIERRFCFEVISPGKSFLLQADSDEAREAWISALQSSIDAAFKHSMAQTPISSTGNSPDPPTMSRASSASSLRDEKTEVDEGKPGASFLEGGRNATLAAVCKVPGNQVCADCGKTDPRWASISLGITLCIECSGVHRSMGVHISKVRSLTLDQWEPEVVKIMYGLGNARVNEIYLAKLPPGGGIKPNSAIYDRQAFIRAKYADRKFVLPLPSAGDPPQNQGRVLTRWTVGRRDMTSSGSQNKDAPDPSPQPEPGSGPADDVLLLGRTGKETTGAPTDEVYDISLLRPNLLLCKAAERANLPVMMLAISNGASPNWNNPDDQGKTPLMGAASVGGIQACELLLLNGARVNDKDLYGRTALHYAVLHNQTGVTCQLLKRRVDVDTVDRDGRTALKIAVDDANADIVTLIRLKKMSNQMKEDDSVGFQQNDELVNDVFRDFTRRATSGLPSPTNDDMVFDLLGTTTWSFKPKDERNCVSPDGDKDNTISEEPKNNSVESTV